MKDVRVSKKAFVFIFLIVMLLMSVASSVSAAQGGQPGKPTDSPGGGSEKTPPGQAKKATPTPTPEATDPTDQPASSPSPFSASPAGDPVSSLLGLGQGIGADIITEFNCRINLGALGGGDIFTTNSRSVSTPSGNTVLKCTGVIPPELVPSKSVRDEGFLCVTFLGATYNSRKVFTPSGIALLTCIINGRVTN